MRTAVPPSSAMISGTDFEVITRSANYNVVVGRDEAEVDERLAGIRDRMLRGGVTAGGMAAFLADRPRWQALQRALMGTVLGALAVRMLVDVRR